MEGLTGTKGSQFSQMLKTFAWMACVQLMPFTAAMSEDLVSPDEVNGYPEFKPVSLRGKVGVTDFGQEENIMLTSDAMNELNNLSVRLGDSEQLSGSFCSIDTTSLEPYLVTPDEVNSLIGMGFGPHWGIHPVSDASSSNSACAELDTIFGSAKDFVVIGITGPSDNIVIGALAEQNRCEKDSTKCLVPNPPLSEEASSLIDLTTMFPMCLALRFCDDADEILKQITFGFASGGENGDGIKIFSNGVQDVYFKGLAFDTAGSLHWPDFSAPLIDPENQDGQKMPYGMHFWVKGKIIFPLKSGDKDVAEVSVTAQFGTYAELEIGGKVSSDMVYFIETMGDMDSLATMAQDFNRVTFQFFFDANAEIEVNLHEIFPVPEGSSLTINQALSSMMEVNIGSTSPSGSRTSLQSIDINASGGTSSDASGNIQVTGSGWDIYGTKDGFQYFYKAASGSVSVEMLVESFEGSDNICSKGGLMIRESLDPGSKHFSIFLTKACGNPNWASLYRSNTNGSTSPMNPNSSMSDRKMHVMISKTGNSFQVYAKPIGSASWIDAGIAQTIDFSSNSFFVGVAVTAHDTSQTATLKGSEFKVHSAVVRKILVKHDLRADYPLSIGELQVYDSAGVNRALGKPTSTSSSCCGNAYPASNGVNGNLHDFTHTENGNEWWQVDLQTDIDVKNVVLHNRVDCCRERLSGVLVSLLDKNDGVIGSYRIGDASATDMFDIDISSFNSAVVRKILVKHDLRADYPLSIGELQVYDSAGVNRALSKPTSTSSSCCGNAYPASNGVNGNLHDFTHTENGNEWWQVDLQTDIDVKNVVLHNRVDCCRERLSGVLVSLLDKNDGVIGSYRIGDASATDMFDIDISSFTSATSLNPSDNINVWYETLSKDKSLRQNTHGYATKLCESKGEKLAMISQICPHGTFKPPAHGHKYGNQWAACSDFDNCWIQVGVENHCQTYNELYGKHPIWGKDNTMEKPFAKFTMCIAQSDLSEENTPLISEILEQKNSNERALEVYYGEGHELETVHLRVDDYLQNSYLAFWMSFHKELDMSTLLSPLGDFGEWIGGMLPTIAIKFQQYIKINMNDLPDFILAMEVSIKFSCQWLADLGNAIKDASKWLGDESLYYNVWPHEVTEFCDQENDHEISAKISFGFKGYYVDLPNTYLSMAAAGNTFKLSMSDLPTCPGPVKLGGKCSVNADCANHKDDAIKQYPNGGYCKNGEIAGIKTSIGCLGTCIEKLPAGADCSRAALNIMDIDPTIAADLGDDDACQSGVCTCGRCADSNHDLRDGSSCKADDECEATSFCDCPGGVCALICAGTCQKKRDPGGECLLDDNDYCKSNNCMCGRCTNNDGRLPDGMHCAADTDCETSSYCNCGGGACGVGGITGEGGCLGTCQKKQEPGGVCWGDDNDECKSNNCMCGRCTDYNGKLSNNLHCNADSDCTSNSFCDCGGGPCGPGGSWDACYGTCQPKRPFGAECKLYDGDYCQSGKCNCHRCADSNNRLPNGYSCAGDGDCQSGWCECPWTGCFWDCSGTCQNRPPPPPPSPPPTGAALESWEKQVNAIDFESTDLSVECNDESYSIGLYSFADHGSHFFLAATNTNEHSMCPAALVFASLQSSKVILQIPNTKDLTEQFYVYDLGTVILQDALAAEVKAAAVDDSKYDLTQNSCAHYAQFIWRNLGFEENADLAEFLIENLLRDEGLVEYAKETFHHGGLRVLSKYIGNRVLYEDYVRDTVISQLNIASNEDFEENEYDFGRVMDLAFEESLTFSMSQSSHEVAPIDDQQHDVIDEIIMACPEKVHSLLTCYEDDHNAVMVCANCVWTDVSAGGLSCDAIHEKLETSIMVCSNSCESVCKNELTNFYLCGVQINCGGTIPHLSVE